MAERNAASNRQAATNRAAAVNRAAVSVARTEVSATPVDPRYLYIDSNTYHLLLDGTNKLQIN